MRAKSCQPLLLPCALAWLASALLGVASAQITLDADFDSGSLDLANTTFNPNLFQLAGRDNFNPGDWKWLYFSASGVEGLKPFFRIDDNFASGDSNLDDHQMVYSYDKQTWHFFDNNYRDALQNTFAFSNNSVFTGDQVFVAYGLPYPDSRVQSHTAAVATSPWVSPTLTGAGDLVIGQSPGGTDDLGRTISPRDMFGYQISDPTATGSKRKIALISGVHANETLGNYTLEGLVDFLLSDDVVAARLRRYSEVFVYPMANPDGRFAGYNRSTVQNEPLDPNRFWDSPDYGGMDDIKVVGDALVADTGGDVDYFIDLHSTVVGKDGHYGFVHPDYQGDPFWQALLALEPEVQTRTASLVDLTGQKFGRDELAAEFTMTLETQFLPGENIDRFHTLGENLARALEEAIGVFADLNFDGQLDPADWQAFVAGSETDLDGLTPIAAYAAGDLNGDGANDISDFGLFKSAYILAHGQAGFRALFSVPEPSSWVIMAALGLCFPNLRSKRVPLNAIERISEKDRDDA